MHKEAYFSAHTLRDKAQEIYQRLEGFRRKRRPAFIPERSALLILDMQDYFLQADSHAFVPSAPAIVPGVELLQEAYRRKDLPVIFTRHINTLQDSRQMSAWWREIITDQNPLSKISPQFDTTGSVCIDKSQYDAFYYTPAEEILRTRRVEQVVICGVMTHLCCDTTARSAFMRGFEVFFRVDGTATYNLDLHLASLQTLAHGFATPILIDQLLAHMEG
jgi:isochorismate hydrolase